ncbi:MAG: MMPL family transporter [Clostridia bacterium]|nr:MMPL family transporter [Clostridia bacterium]
MIKKFSNFIVNKRNIVLAVMLVLAVASIICSQFVEINEDMTKYLPDDSNMKAGLDIMEDEFPEMETSNSIRVMFDDLTDAQKETVLAELSTIPNVDSVDYDAESSDYNKDNHTLFVLNMSCEYGSDEEAAIESALESQFADYTVVWKNNDTGFPGIPVLLIVVALAILLTVLFIMCDSWIEPLLFLVVIGVAVVINGGTNLILGNVASITNSISAILQLVLSMDYSIILMNRYRQEKQLEPDKKQAMKNALAASFSSVASSVLTTVVGLLMLVFMSFKIGANLGIVLAKGVFISMVCVLTMLPSIILACDKLIQKTAKKSLHIPMGWAAKFSYKMRHVMVGVFAVLFVGFFILQQQTGTAYTLTGDDEISDVFPQSNTVVMVYENQDEDKMNDLIAELEKDENVKSVFGYGTILGKPYTSGELAEVLGSMSGDISLGSGVIDMLYYDYYKSDNAEPYKMTLYEFVDFLQNKVANDPTFSPYLDENTMPQLQALTPYINKEELQKQRSASELSAMLGVDESLINTIFNLSFNGNAADKTMSMEETVDFILANAAIKNYMGDEMLGQLQMAQMMIKASVNETAFAATDLADMLGMDSSMLDLLYLYAASTESADPEWTMTLEALLGYMMDDVLTDPRFESVINDDMKQKLTEALTTLEDGKKQLVTDNYSRLVITTSYPEDGEDTTAFFAGLEQFANDKLDGDYYLVGNSAMNYEMQKTFDNEQLFITLLTALAIFLIVAITFKSISIPMILVLLVQCGVYITITITGALNGSIYYLALLIVECILMGSTVDYGILLTNYYCEARKTMDVKDSLKHAYAGSIHTIMSSGLILILVTAVVGGLFENPTVTSIVKTISMGALCATLLILFVLPGVLAACDKLVTKKRDRFEQEKELKTDMNNN